MDIKHLKGWLKHADFILADIFCLQLCYVLVYLFLHGFSLPYRTANSRYEAVVLGVSQLAVIFFLSNYSGVLRRTRFDELIAIIRYTIFIMLAALVYMFMVQSSEVVSRLQFGLTGAVFVPINLLVRQLNKRRVFRKGIGKSRSVVLVTGTQCAEAVLQKLNDPNMYHDFCITGVILMDADKPVKLAGMETEAMPLNEEALKDITHGWVDEIFLFLPADMASPTELLDDLKDMGITVSYTNEALNDERWPITDIRKIGRYKVLTSSVRIVPAWQLAVKRLMDIAGGLVGCVLTGIIFLFIAPIIYIKSPGPIFFTQQRVGKNGKIFTMHKFRSMYMDAEERKAELMSQNKVKDDMMFKMDDDPRIIGSEKKNRHGKPAGIGNFIRNTSIDEFPQFFDILIGKMSLVGWRPCTLQEWEKYSVQHRIRASMKPGLTGMWQVCGRSEITDFDEVVRLDREYLENWNLLLDIKIILRTVKVVIARKGAK